MEEYYKGLAARITTAQIWAAVSTAIVLLQLLVKFVKEFKAVKDGLEALWGWTKTGVLWFVKGLNYRKRIMEEKLKIRTLLEQIEKQVIEIQHEVKFNGGKYKLTDAVRDLQAGQMEIKNVLEKNAQIRQADELLSNRMIFKMDNEGLCTSISDVFLKFFGCLESEVLDEGFENLLLPDEVHEMRHKWNAAITKQSSFRDVQHIRNQAGTYLKCSVVAYPIIMQEKLLGFNGVIEIINE